MWQKTQDWGGAGGKLTVVKRGPCTGRPQRGKVAADQSALRWDKRLKGTHPHGCASVQPDRPNPRDGEKRETLSLLCPPELALLHPKSLSTRKCLDQVCLQDQPEELKCYF